jgi:hypothetical protein
MASSNENDVQFPVFHHSRETALALSDC